MSVKVKLREGGVGIFVAAAAMSLVACGQPPPGAGSGGPAASATATPVRAGLKAAARPELAFLGPGDRRVALVVVPGDALIEVDGQPAYRRDGVIDLTGKVGDVRRVRVWKGAKVEEKAVTIQEAQPSPPLVDLNEAPPPKPVAKAAKKPARYGGFDD